MMRTYFPLTKEMNSAKELLTVILAYLLAGVFVGIIQFVASLLPLIGGILIIVCKLISVYLAIGIIYSVLVYFKIVE